MGNSKGKIDKNLSINSNDIDNYLKFIKKEKIKEFESKKEKKTKNLACCEEFCHSKKFEKKVKFN